jgi:hypothetical protein
MSNSSEHPSQADPTQKPPNPVGKLISAALAQHEINHLLDVVFATISPETQAPILAQLNPDTSNTLRQILQGEQQATPSPSSRFYPLASLAKQKQTWSKLWREWDDIIFAAAEEDGRYTGGSEDPVLPYFDAFSFIEDLDQVANQMLPMLQVAFDKEFFPDTSFAQALLEAEVGISRTFPPGTIIQEKYGLGPKLTTCLLQWEWMLTLEEEQNAYYFATRLRQWEEKFALVRLANNAISHFFTQLSQASSRCIFEGLSSEQDTLLWRSVLQDNSQSHWHILYSQLVQQYASPS